MRLTTRTWSLVVAGTAVLPLLFFGLTETLLAAAWSVPGGGALARPYFLYVWNEGAAVRGARFAELCRRLDDVLRRECRAYFGKDDRGPDVYVEVKPEDPPPVRPSQLRRVLRAPDLYLYEKRRLSYVYFYRRGARRVAAVYRFALDPFRNYCLWRLETVPDAAEKRWTRYYEWKARRSDRERKKFAALRLGVRRRSAEARERAVKELRRRAEALSAVLSDDSSPQRRNAVLDLCALAEAAPAVVAATADILERAAARLCRELDSAVKSFPAAGGGTGSFSRATMFLFVEAVGRLGAALGSLGPPTAHEENVCRFAGLLRRRDPALQAAVLTALGKLGYKAAPAVPELRENLRYLREDFLQRRLRGPRPPGSPEEEKTAKLAARNTVQVVRLLGELGHLARSALPELQEARGDSRPRVRAAAVAAVRDIESECRERTR